MRVICNLNALHSFSLLTVFFHWVFRLKIFNEAIKGVSKEEKIRSSNNLADLLSHCQHQHLRRLYMALEWGKQTSYMIKIILFRGSNMDLKCTVLFFPYDRFFVPLDFFDLRFLTRQLQNVQEYQYDTSSKGEFYELS